MNYEWKDVKTSHAGRLTAKERARFCNEQNFMTIAEYTDPVTNDTIVRSYTLYYCIASSDNKHPKMHGLIRFPSKIDSMEKAKESAETYLIKELKKRVEDMRMRANTLDDAIHVIIGENSNK